MEKIKNNLVIREDDYSLLITYLKNARRQPTFDRRNANEIISELEKATLVNKINFPGDVIGLNSKVRIKEEGKSEEMEFVIVTPERANITEKRMSMMAPIGTILMGIREGQKVKCNMPAGNKSFTIVAVNNDFEKNNA